MALGFDLKLWWRNLRGTPRLAALPPEPQQGWICATCGQRHTSLPAAAFSSPSAWHNSSEEERARDFVLNSDFCIWKNEHYFIRCGLEIPIRDHEEAFAFGVWSTLSRQNFERYYETFDDPIPPELPTMFGWFSNSLPGYPDTENLKCDVIPQSGRRRPLIALHEADHPLVLQQRNGVSFDEASAYLHAHMNF